MWELYHKESWALKNWCFWTVVVKKTLESPLDCKEIQPVNPKGNQSWIFIGRSDAEAETPNTLATWCEELTHWKRLWCWARLKAGGEGDDRGWDGWMSSQTQRTWVWASSGSWWPTGKPGLLQSMGLQRVRHGWATELNWTDAVHKHVDAQRLAGTRRLMILLISPPTHQKNTLKNVHKLITLSWNLNYKTYHPLQAGTHSSEGMSPLWPPLPGKAVKLFFSTSPKLLSLRFNSVSGYRGQLQLHRQGLILWKQDQETGQRLWPLNQSKLNPKKALWDRLAEGDNEQKRLREAATGQPTKALRPY